MKLLSLIAVFGINAVVSVCLFFFLILGLNGFRGDDANWGINAYAVLGFLTAVLTAILALVATNYFINKKGFSGITAAFLAIGIFTALGVALNFVSLFIGVIITSIKSGKF